MSSSGEDSSTSESSFEQLHEALEKSSSRNTRLLAVLLFFLLYLLIIVAGTTDLQLLLPESTITLPMLGVELPLFGFYIVAPALILILHFNFLLNLFNHARKLMAWYEAKTEQQDVLLPGFFFNYTLLFKEGTPNYFLLRVLLAIILCFFPLLLLLFVQLRFADYHSISMTAHHFVLVLLDFIVLLNYWYRIIHPELLDEKYDNLKNLLRFYRREGGFWPILFEMAGKIENPFSLTPWSKKLSRLLFLPFVVLTVIPRATWRFIKPGMGINPIYRVLFAGVLLSSATCLLVVILITQDYFYDSHWYIPRLDVTGETLVTSPPGDIILHAYLTRGKSADSAWMDHAVGIDLRGRDLQFARLTRAKIWKGQLDSANLSHAQLMGAKLNGASLVESELNGANLERAELNGADLKWTELNGAILEDAKLNGAVLDSAKLNGADLRWAELNGAMLPYAELNGAILLRAELNGAMLPYAELNAAILRSAELNGADLKWAKLNVADLWGAELNGADLEHTQLIGTHLKGAELNGTWMEGTMLSGSLGFVPEQTMGVYCSPGIDSYRFAYFVHWEQLKKDSLSIPDAIVSVGSYRQNLRQFYLEVLKGAEKPADSIAPALRNIQPDSAGFVAVRESLSCQSAYIAQGLLEQHSGSREFEIGTYIQTELGLWLDSLTAQIRQTLLDYMCQNCPDSLAVVRDRADDRLRATIEDFLQNKCSDKDTVTNNP